MQIFQGTAKRKGKLFLLLSKIVKPKKLTTSSLTFNLMPQKNPLNPSEKLLKAFKRRTSKSFSVTISELFLKLSRHTF